MSDIADAIVRSRARFVDRLLAQSPNSVLDVGCGDGHLLRACRDAGVPAAGVEAGGERLAALAEEGFDVRQASADALPFADASFEWVALRHVLHHLVHPDRAVAEAARVAARGLVLAEPWISDTLPARVTTGRVDRWTKRQDRRLGMVHGPDHDLGALRGLLPGGSAAWSVETERFEAPDLRLPEDVQAWLDRGLEGLAPEHPERAEHARLSALAAETGVTYPGTAILVARRNG